MHCGDVQIPALVVKTILLLDRCVDVVIQNMVKYVHTPKYPLLAPFDSTDQLVTVPVQKWVHPTTPFPA